MAVIDPEGVQTCEQLTEQLVELFHQGGWSRHRLAEAAGLSPATVQGLLNGSTTMMRAGTLVAFVTACRQDPEPWLEARARAIQAARSERLSHKQWEAELQDEQERAEIALEDAEHVVGRLIGELDDSDALAMEVQRAVLLPLREGLLWSPQPILPVYLPRPEVDDRLRFEVAAARTGSRMVVVIGDSSTGKTRACWEAIRAELPDWKVWHPLTPQRPLAVVEALKNGLVRPKTVIWLNETQTYLDAGLDGEQAASALQELLTDPACNPVLILGSMWPGPWADLGKYRGHWSSGIPDPEGKHPNQSARILAESSQRKDPHRAARMLLGPAINIPVPRSFTDQQISGLRSLIDTDARLQAAVSAAEGGRITQFLAGASDLLQRYHHADPASTAVLSAAIDALRFDHGDHLPEPLLEEAAVGYIDSSDWDQMTDDWFTRTLNTLTAPRRQMPGPLSRHRPRPGDPPVRCPLYRLAHILEQQGRVDRQAIGPPTTFWTSVAHHARTLEDRVHVARAAFASGYHDHAMPLFQRTAADGDIDSMLYLSWLYEQRGHGEEAERWAEQAAESGETKALLSLTMTRLAQGNNERAEHLALRAAEAGNTNALRSLIRRYEQDGEQERAVRLTQHAAKRVENLDLKRVE